MAVAYGHCVLTFFVSLKRKELLCSRFNDFEGRINATCFACPTKKCPRDAAHTGAEIHQFLTARTKLWSTSTTNESKALRPRVASEDRGHDIPVKRRCVNLCADEVTMAFSFMGGHSVQPSGHIRITPTLGYLLAIHP